MFYRKLITYVLLVLYGAPSAVGPHWHSHCCHNADLSCEVALSCDECLSCTCQHSHSFEKQTQSDPPTQIVASDTICDGCLICHFYACMPFSGLALETHVQGSLSEYLLIEGHGQELTFEQLQLARGPPPQAAFI